MTGEGGGTAGSLAEFTLGATGMGDQFGAAVFDEIAGSGDDVL